MFSANAVTAGVPGQNWIAKSGPNRTYEQGAYGNGIYLYLANNGYLATSTDANTWTESTAMRSVTTANTRSIVYSSGLTGFAVGSEGAVVYSSNNGASWTRTFISGMSSVSSVTAGGSTLVAYDSGGRVATSTNGTTWTYRGDMTTLAGWGSGAFSGEPYGGAYGNSLFMLVGFNVSPSNFSTCATSPDGITWTNRPGLNTAVSANGGTIRNVAWAPTLGMWFAGGFASSPVGGIIAYSSDNGANWTVSSGATSFLSGISVRWITEVNGTIVAMAGTNTIITSRDGVNWQSQTGLSNLGITTDSYLQNGGILVVAQQTAGRLAVSV